MWAAVPARVMQALKDQASRYRAGSWPVAWRMASRRAKPCTNLRPRSATYRLQVTFGVGAWWLGSLCSGSLLKKSGRSHARGCLCVLLVMVLEAHEQCWA